MILSAVLKITILAGNILKLYRREVSRCRPVYETSNKPPEVICSRRVNQQQSDMELKMLTGGLLKKK